MGSVDQTKSRMGFLRDVPAGDGGHAYLLVVEGDSSSLFHLPRTGAVVVGRGDADLRVAHPSVSRRHATFRIDNGVVRIADLGSHNGTRLNGEPVAESRRLASGDVVMCGDVVMVVHVTAAPEPARAEHPESDWRRRLAEELDRAITYGRSLAVVAWLAPDPAAYAAIQGAARLIDVVGRGDDGHPLLLLPEAERDDAREIVERVLAAVPAARAGLALSPADACDVDTLLFAARAAVRRAEPGQIAGASDGATTLDLGGRRVLVADPTMSHVYTLLQRLAASELPVLVTGETGVGKENAAYAVHHWSKRTGPFIAVNCAALAPESLVESELFGHDKGAFTGATAAKAGLFESAAGGTVFLDEVGELPQNVQAKLLRVLETRKITRLGETRERPVDVRLVAATNRSLEDEAKLGRFRQDLFFRLGGATVILPPLRDRRCEIAILARQFLAEACARTDRGRMTIRPATMQVLLTHSWPGNVRELRNTIEYVAAAAPDDVVEPSDLPERLGGSETPPAPEPAPAAPEAPAATAFRPIADEIRELERRRMVEALAASNGVKTKAAQLIDMPIRTFTLKLKQYRM